MKASQHRAEGLERVASARSSGARPGNIQPALIEAFGWPKGAPQFSYIAIPMADSQKPQPHPFIFLICFSNNCFMSARSTGTRLYSAHKKRSMNFGPALRKTPILKTILICNPPVLVGEASHWGCTGTAGHFPSKTLCSQ